MSAFDWLRANGRHRSRATVADVEPENEPQSASAPGPMAEASRLVTMWVGDKPGLALGAAFVAGVTLGWMIKRW